MVDEVITIGIRYRATPEYPRALRAHNY